MVPFMIVYAVVESIQLFVNLFVAISFTFYCFSARNITRTTKSSRFVILLLIMGYAFFFASLFNALSLLCAGKTLRDNAIFGSISLIFALVVYLMHAYALRLRTPIAILPARLIWPINIIIALFTIIAIVCVGTTISDIVHTPPKLVHSDGILCGKIDGLTLHISMIFGAFVITMDIIYSVSFYRYVQRMSVVLGQGFTVDTLIVAKHCLRICISVLCTEFWLTLFALSPDWGVLFTLPFNFQILCTIYLWMNLKVKLYDHELEISAKNSNHISQETTTSS